MIRAVAAVEGSIMPRFLRCLFLILPLAILPAGAEPAADNLARAKEVTAGVCRDFWMPERGLFRQKPGVNDPEMIWGGGILFSMLTAAARNEPETYHPMLLDNFKGLQTHWDSAVEIPGYEPCPTRGNGNDKYYDDNAWMVITFTEAWHQTGKPEFARQAYETLKFVISGWDDVLDGGIWWHEKHKGNSKNTCSNAPTAVGCLMLAKLRPDRHKAMIDKALEIRNWTRTLFQDADGLYMDSINTETRRMNRAKLTYNSGLMLRAELMLHQATGKAEHLEEAKRIGAAAKGLCHRDTLVYRDPPKWAHLMVEADLELHRLTGDAALLDRARANADSYYKRWKEKGNDIALIDQASIARTLWLVAEMESPEGREFWKKVDAPAAGR